METPGAGQMRIFRCGGELGSGMGQRRNPLAFRQQLGETKVEKLYLAAFGQKNIRRLDVAMNDGLA